MVFCAVWEVGDRISRPDEAGCVSTMLGSLGRGHSSRPSAAHYAPHLCESVEESV